MKATKQRYRDALRVSMIRQQIAAHRKMNPGKPWSKLSAALVMCDLSAKNVETSISEINAQEKALPC